MPVVEELKAKAKAEGLWNMFMPPHSEPVTTARVRGAGLTNLEYALCAEVMGRVGFASEVFNCSAPDTGNMEVLQRYGTRRAEGEVAAAADERRDPLGLPDDRAGGRLVRRHQHRDPIERDGDDYVINGRKWWSSGVGDPRCKIAIVMGKTDPDAAKHEQQSQILVPLDTPGVKIVRMLPVFGYDDAPHGHAEVILDNVRVPASNLLLGEGRGFEIAQGRLGPGRIHHCMRTIGVAEVALEKMCKRLLSRVAFGKRIAEHSVWEQRIAEARIDIEMTRLLCLKAADMMDKVGNKGAQLEIAMIKVAGAAHGAEDHRRRDPGARRRRRHDRLRPRQGLRRHPHPAPRRRPGRSAQPRHRPLGVFPAQQSGSRRAMTGAAALEQAFTGTKPVEERHRIDQTKLEAWLKDERPGLRRSADSAAVQGRPVEPDLPARHAGTLPTSCGESPSASCCPRRMRSIASFA